MRNTKEETAEDLARDLGKMRDRLIKISLRNKQTGKPGEVSPHSKARLSVPGKKPPAVKRQVPPQLKPYLFRKK